MDAMEEGVMTDTAIKAARKGLSACAKAGLLLALMGSATLAQAQSNNPGNNPVDGDLVRGGEAPSQIRQAPAGTSFATPSDLPPAQEAPANRQITVPGNVPEGVPANDRTYRGDDLIGAAEGVFGKGAKGLASVIQDILKKQGLPNAYIVGREVGGAFAVGLRYGSGTLYHKTEGQRDVYWTGPSIGFDVGGNAAKTFVLVYNLYDTEELYHRYGAGEGQAYAIGGFNVSYLRRGDKVLIPVRLGVGMRLGINGGYMKFSKKQNWLPF
jgi:hypothetical protein